MTRPSVPSTSSNQEWDDIELKRDVDLVLSHFVDWEQDDIAFLEFWFDPILKKYSLPPHGFDHRFIASLASCGWFIFAFQTLAPKFHRLRCVIDLERWDTVEWYRTLIQRSTNPSTSLEPTPYLTQEPDGSIKLRPLRKRLRRILEGTDRYQISLNTDFSQSIERVNASRPGVFGSWVEPELVVVLDQLCSHQSSVTGDGVESLSWELRDEHNQLVACDIGIRAGAVYSSMTGFSDRQIPSIGIVQLVAEAMLLKAMGFRFWDLGMESTYKFDLGAVQLTASQYRSLFRKHKNGFVTGTAEPTSLLTLPGFPELKQAVEKNSGASLPDNRGPSRDTTHRPRHALEHQAMESWCDQAVSDWIAYNFPGVGISGVNGKKLLDLPFLVSRSPSKSTGKKIHRRATRLWHEQRRRMNP